MRQTCRDTLASLEGTATSSTVRGRRRVPTSSQWTPSPVTLRPDGVTAVASCDIYEFDGEEISAITSYAVEVDPGDPGAQPPPRV